MPDDIRLSLSKAGNTEFAANSFDAPTRVDVQIADKPVDVVVIDTSIEGYEDLAAGVNADAHVVYIDGESEGFDDLVTKLDGVGSIGSLSIFSHGGEGFFVLGNTYLDSASLEDYAGALNSLAGMMADGGDILLYGCLVGSGAGLAFVERLAELTGADVAASDDLTGSAAVGGDWDLEVEIGDVDADIPVSSAALNELPVALAFTGTVTFSTVSAAGGYSLGAGVDAAVDQGGYTFDLDGANNSITANGDLGYAYTSAGESSVTISISGGATWDPTSIYIRNIGGAADSFNFTTNLGGAVSSGSIADLGNATIDLTSLPDGVTSLTISVGDGSGQFIFDTLGVANASGNSAPVLGGTPADDSATEDVATAIDLSAYNVSDADGDTITLTLSVNRGTIASVDGNGTFDGVTIGTSGTTSMTLQGTAANLNTYLNDTSHITFTTDSNDTTTATLTVTPNDGTEDGTADTVSITVTPVNDSPVLDDAQSPTLTTIVEDAGDDDGSGADGDDDGTNNTNNGGTTVADLVVDGSITDVDGGAVESIAVTVVDNTNGVWQYSLNGGTNWLNFTGTTGLSVDIETNARLLDSNDLIRFVPDADFSGTATITFRAWDESGGVAGGTGNASITGGNAAFSTANDTATITVTAVNDDPTISGLVADISVTEDTASNLDISLSNFADVDSAGTVFVTLSVDSGTLAATSGGGVTVSGSGSGALTLTGTFADINTFLDTASNVQYTPGNNVSGDNAATLTVTANDDDGSGNVVLDTANIDITGVNDAPVLNPAFTPTLTGIDEDAGDDDGSGADGDDDGTNNANNGGTTVADLVVDGSITDVDGGAAESIAVTVVDNTNGLWQYSTDGGTSWNNFSGTTGSSVDISSVARLLEGTDLVRFVPGADYQGSATITFRAWDETSGVAGGTADTSSNGGATAFSSDTDTASVTVTGVNDTPVFSGLDGAPSYTENGSALTLDADVTVSDQELASLNGGSGDYSGASLTVVRNGGADGDDALSVVSGGNLTVAGGPNGGGTITAGGNVIATISNAGDDDELTITFADNGTTPTTALVNEVLQAIQYSNSNNDPGSSVQLNWTFSDGNSANAQGTGDNPGTDSGSTTVSITEVNDEPTLTATGQNPTFVEGGTASDLFSGVTADTIETGQTVASFTVTVTNVLDGASEILNADGTAITLTDANSGTTAGNSLSYSVSLSGNTATVTFSGGTMSEAATQTLIDGMSYENGSDDPSTGSNRVFTITSLTDSGGTADGGDDTATLTLSSTVSLTAVNDAPAITGVFGDTSTAIVAGTGAGDVTGLNDAGVTNADSSDYNGGFLTIAQTAGTTNGSWGVDGTTMTSGGDATISAGETIQVNGVTIGTVDGANDGQGSNSLTINFTTANATSANIETLLQQLTYSGPSGIDTRSFTLTLNDNDGTTDGGDEDVSGSFSIDITPNPPVFTNLDGDSFDWTEGDSATDLDVGGNAALSDADSGNFDGGNVTIEYVSGQQADDLLEIDTSGSVSLSAGQTAGSTVSVSGTAIGTIQAAATGGSGEDLIINLNSDATPALVQTLIGQLQYNNAGGDNPTDGDRTIRITVSDGDGATSADNDITVNVDPVNDDPSITGLVTDVSVTEDAASDLDLSGSAFADDDSTGVATVTLTASAGTLAASSGGSVTVGGSGTGTLTLTGTFANINTFLDTASNVQYTGAADAEGDDAATVSITANDGDGSGDVSLGSVNVDITGTNDAPTASNGSVNIQEGGSHEFEASDFGFSDVDSGDSLASVRIDTLTVGSGTLTLSGVAVTAGDVITVADINAGNLVYEPASDDFGTGLLTFTFSVNDGTVFAASPSNMTVNVANVVDNSPPRDVVLSPANVNEEVEGAVIGTLSATDPEGTDVTFALVGDDRFTLDGNVLSLADGVSFDFETNEQVSLEIKVTDGDGVSSTAIIIVRINDVVEPVVGDDNSNVITGDDAFDNLRGGGGNDTIDGGGGDDFLRGDDGDDRISGGAGNDRSFAGNNDNGNDTVEGNDGNDVLGGGNGNDLIVGGNAGTNVNDSNPGSSDDDTLFGGSGDDLIVAGSYNTQSDTVVNTGGGSNLLWGGGGNDRVFGDDGDDVIGGGLGNDSVQAGGGNDTLYGGRSGDETNNDTLRGGNGDDLILASSDDDVVFGEAGDDTLFGGAGDDTVDGGSGSDILWAGGGDDQLTGGSGADTFVFGNVSGNDTVTDFNSSEDVLDLRFASTDFASVAEVQAAATATTQGGQTGVLIDLGDGDSVFVVGLGVGGITDATVTV